MAIFYERRKRSLFSLRVLVYEIKPGVVVATASQRISTLQRTSFVFHEGHSAATEGEEGVACPDLPLRGLSYSI